MSQKFKCPACDENGLVFNPVTNGWLACKRCDGEGYTTSPPHHPECHSVKGRPDQCNCGTINRLPKTKEEALCLLKMWAEREDVQQMVWGGHEWQGINPSFADELRACVTILEKK